MKHSLNRIAASAPEPDRSQTAMKATLVIRGVSLAAASTTKPQDGYRVMTACVGSVFFLARLQS